MNSGPFKNAIYKVCLQIVVRIAGIPYWIDWSDDNLEQSSFKTVSWNKYY